jgi:roadblock/LC7 domain-containing protein
MAALMDKTQAFELGQAALAFVLQTLKIGAANQASNPVTWGNETEVFGTKVPVFTRRQDSFAYQCVNGMRAVRKEIVEADAKMTDIEKELFRGLLANQTACGNCAEHAALAFSWLYGNNHFPVEVLEVTGGDHAFCVLNRDGATDPATPDQWNEESVYIDPWRKRVSFGRAMPRENTHSAGGFGLTKYHFRIKTRAEAPEAPALGRVVGKTMEAMTRLR